MRPDEFDEAGRITALAYREFARPGDPHEPAYTDEARRAGRKLLSLNTALRMTAARQM